MKNEKDEFGAPIVNPVIDEVCRPKLSFKLSFKLKDKNTNKKIAVTAVEIANKKRTLIARTPFPIITKELESNIIKDDSYSFMKRSIQNNSHKDEFYNQYLIMYQSVTKIFDNIYLEKDNPNITYAIFGKIIGALNFNSNKVVLCNNLAFDIGVSKQSFYNAIKNLISLNVIAKHNTLNTYVVNHNIMFKGKFEDFVKDYKILYPDD